MHKPRTGLSGRSILWSALVLSSLLGGCGERRKAPPRVAPPDLVVELEPPEFEIRAEYTTTVDPESGRSVVDGDLMIVLEDDATRADLERDLATLPFEVRVTAAMPTLGIFRITLARDIHAARPAVEALASVSVVSYDEVIHESRAFNDPALSGAEAWKSWGIRRIGAPEAWDSTLGRGTVVVIDDGIQTDHEDLAGRIQDAWTWQAAQKTGAKPRRGTSSVAQRGPNGPLQECAHGTHVAGTIAAIAGNGKGTVGIAPGVRVVSLQVLVIKKENGKWVKSGSFASIASALEFTLRLTPRPVAINMSIGASPPGTDMASLRDPEKQGPVIQRLRKRYSAAYLHALRKVAQQGIVIVKSAGNDNVPAGYSRQNDDASTICVGAIREGDKRSVFSNYNVAAAPTTVDVCAPGTRIWSSMWKGTYVGWNGTSMAAPHVTGVVALMKAVNPELKVADVRRILRETGARLKTDHDVGPLIDAVAAVARARQTKAGGGNPAPVPPQIDWTTWFTPGVHVGGRARFVERSVEIANRSAQSVEFRIAFLRAFPKSSSLEWHWWPGASTPTGEYSVTVPAGGTALVADDQGRTIGASRIVMRAAVPRSVGVEVLSLGTTVLVPPNPALGGAFAYEAERPETWTFTFRDPERDRVRVLVRDALQRERSRSGGDSLRTPDAAWSGAQTLADALGVLEDPGAIERAALNQLKGLHDSGLDVIDAVSFWFAVSHASEAPAEEIAQGALDRMLRDRTAQDLLLGASPRGVGVGAAAVPEGTLITIVAAQPR